MKVFVDSNIPMYVAGSEHPNRAPASRFLERGVDGDFELCTSTEVLQEIFYRYASLERLDLAEKVYDFFVTTPGGLDVFATKELRSLKGVRNLRVHRRRRLSRVHFRFERSPSRLLDLRTVSGVFADLGKVEGVTVGRPGIT